MNVLIIGGGGREHAIAYKVKQSIRVEYLKYVNPFLFRQMITQVSLNSRLKIMSD